MTSRPRGRARSRCSFCNVVVNSLSNIFENDLLDSDQSSSVATLKSLTHCEFVPGSG